MGLSALIHPLLLSSILSRGQRAMQNTPYSNNKAAGEVRGRSQSAMPSPAIAALPQGAQREVFNRPPRIWTSPPQETITIPTLPTREHLPAMPGMMSLLLPVIMMAVLVGVYFLINPGSPQQLAFLLPMALFSIMTPAANLLGAYQKTRSVKQRGRESEKKYRKALSGRDAR